MLGLAMLRYRLLRCAAASVIAAAPMPAIAQAQTFQFDIPAQSLDGALRAFARATHQQVLFDGAVVRGKRTQGVTGSHSADDGLNLLLAGSGLTASRSGGGAYVVKLGNGPAAPETTASSGEGTAAGQNESAQQQAIVVTGTHIRGGITGSPSTVLRRADIQSTGYSTVQQVMSSLPAAFSGGAERGNGLGDESQVAQDFGNVSTVNLRGLGPNATLVLMNGHRLPTMASIDVVDISMIPLNIIDRIDVVPDGASAIYGSDAVAGTVNIITRTDFNGLQVHGRYGGATRGGYTEGGADAVAGLSSDQGHLLGSYDFLDQSALSASDRTFSRISPEPTDLLPHDRTQNAYMDGAVQLTPQLEIYAKALGSVRHDDQISNYGYATYTENTHLTQYQISGGLRYQFPRGWLVDAYGSTARSQLKNKQDQIGASPSHNDFNHRMSDVEVDANGPLFRLPGGNADLAVGGSYRHESYLTAFAEEPALNRSAQRDSESLYAELLIPLFSDLNAQNGIRSLQLSTAVRYDNYKGIGSTVNPKVGIIWSPVDDLKLRGTFGTSFRAPTLANLYAGYELDALVYLPNPAAPGGETLTMYRAFGPNADLKPETARTWSIGEDWTPHTFPGMTFSTTLFVVNYKNRIENVINSPFSSFTNPAYSPLIDFTPDPALLQYLASQPTIPNAGFLNFSGEPVEISAIQAIVDNRFQNASKSFVDGIDFSLRYEHPFLFGLLRFDASGTYLLHGTFQLTTTAPTSSFLNRVDQPINLRVRGHLGLQHGPFTIDAALNYTNGYTNADVTPAVPVSSWTTLDLRFAYTATDHDVHGALKGLQLALAVQNLFDVDPPHVNEPTNFRAPIGYDPTNANPVGRFISIDVSKKF